jgi:hypothetical protein
MVGLPLSFPKTRLRIKGQGLTWQLINIASHISALAHIRRMPTFANMPVEVNSYSLVPKITPNTGNIPIAYPIGVY